MPGPLIAYDKSGNVLAVLDHLVVPDEEGNAVLVDFEAHEASGGKLRECWEVSGAAGSCHWPEHLGESVHEFRVHIDKRFTNPARRLVHRRSGHVRDRVEVERAIEQRVARSPRDKDGRRVVDVREVTGSPSRPLRLDKHGRTVDEVTPRGSGLARSGR